MTVQNQPRSQESLNLFGASLLATLASSLHSFAMAVASTVFARGSPWEIAVNTHDLAGETALKDKTDYHLKSTIATTVALGGLAGFSQFGAVSAFTGGGIDSYRSGISQQAGQTGQQLIGRSLNRPPTITIAEGHAVNVYLSEDIRLPEFAHEVIR